MQAVLTRPSAGDLGLGRAATFDAVRLGTRTHPLISGSWAWLGGQLVGALAVLLAIVVVGSGPLAAARPQPMISVIVREQPSAGSAPERLVHQLGGQLGMRLEIIDGFSALVPVSAVERLATHEAVHSVNPDSTIRLYTDEGADDRAYDMTRPPGSMYDLTKSVNADFFWQQGVTGRGVDVALIDTGVAPVQGLTVDGTVVNGPDISFESQDHGLRHIDTYGHGTHLAGIIAGRDEGSTKGTELGDPRRFAGMAPGARLVNLKVANRNGAADVSQVIAAVDWVVQHRNSHGLNIRVLNLSFGTDSTQDYRLDPLSFAVEVAWREGIVVVTAAGNGRGGADRLNNPATNPFVIAVGAADNNGTYSTRDDVVQAWSSRGDGKRNPDVVAPGKSIASLRVAGSYLDTAHPNARSGERYFRGSGTSQAAAVVSGAAALIIEQRPKVTPDQLKRLLMTTAVPLDDVGPRAQGAGMIDLKRAFLSPTPEYVQDFPPAKGTGSLDEARGSHLVVSPDGEELRGELDIFGSSWSGSSWSRASALGSSWSGGEFMGVSWSGSSWSGSSWSGSSWSSSSWSGSSWSSPFWE